MIRVGLLLCPFLAQGMDMSVMALGDGVSGPFLN